ncbi:hypothetical protein [Paenibacillus sp. IHBB 3054]|uniref:hypothetical protein n=1 Tax=Paenibacillus sp. IHBB 3054 TaxID=3425689 RepID=UPI003F680FAA
MATLFIQGYKLLELDPLKTDLGTQVSYWIGDQLPFRVGEIPGGYLPSAGFKVYYREAHVKGFFSYGPYLENNSLGSMNIYIFMGATNRLDGSSAAFTIDVVDAHDLNNPLAKRTFYVKDLPENSDGFIVYGTGIPIKPGQSLEVRVLAEGGADLQLFFLRTETSGL